MKKTLTIAICLLSVFVFQGCAKDGGGGAGNSSANAQLSTKSIVGSWLYIFPESNSSISKVKVAVMNEDQTFSIVTMRGSDSALDKTFAGVFRKELGNYSMAGEILELNYSYETCDKTGKETVNIKFDSDNSDRIIVSNSDQSIMFTMERMKTQSTDVNFTAVEDKDCDWK